jgi:hypothetical protein
LSLDQCRADLGQRIRVANHLLGQDARLALDELLILSGKLFDDALQCGAQGDSFFALASFFKWASNRLSAVLIRVL